VVLGERLIRLLAAAVAAPERSIGGLEILDPSERDTILRVWNDTARAIAGRGAAADQAADQATDQGDTEGGAAASGAAATLPELFAAQAARTPEAVAVVFEDRSLSYAALDAHANRLAHHLRGLGVGPETVVGLCVERSPEMVIGLLGILKAGGAYLPLDPGYPAERLSFMLRDAGAPVMVTQSALLPRLPGATIEAASGGAGTRLVRLDADWPAIARQPATAPALALDPRHPAYVIYTGLAEPPRVVEHASLPIKCWRSVKTLMDDGFRSALFISARSMLQLSRRCCRSPAVVRCYQR
jgi:non-ribosomal peptide synthetase component F